MTEGSKLVYLLYCFNNQGVSILFDCCKMEAWDGKFVPMRTSQPSDRQIIFPLEILGLRLQVLGSGPPAGSCLFYFSFSFIIYTWLLTLCVLVSCLTQFLLLLLVTAYSPLRATYYLFLLFCINATGTARV